MSPLATVGIAGLSRYAPARFMPAAELSIAAGIPAEVLVSKFGLAGKHISEPDEHVSAMCISAARPLVDRFGRENIDAVAYFGSHWKDYSVWQAAPKIQDALGIEGYAFELVNVSAGAPVAVKIVSDMLRADEHLRSVLLVGASKESHLIDLANERSRFAFGFGDGAVAALLQRGHERNVVLGSSLYTDGSFAEDVCVPGGGSKHPADSDTVANRMHFLEVRDPQDMKERLDPITIKNFLRVTLEALERGGLGISDIDWVLPIHMKRSIHDEILKELGVPGERSVYLDHYGHMSAVDPLFSLSMASDQGRLSSGDIVVLLAAGTGYTWAASIIRWGPN